MQVDDPLRGFSYSREGPLDMHGPLGGVPAAQVLATISVEELTKALSDYADEPYADRIAQAIVEARKTEPLTTTVELGQTTPASQRPGDVAFASHAR